MVISDSSCFTVSSATPTMMSSEVPPNCMLTPSRLPAIIGMIAIAARKMPPNSVRRFMILVR